MHTGIDDNAIFSSDERVYVTRTAHPKEIKVNWDRHPILRGGNEHIVV